MRLNTIFAGVGGQGLILTAGILMEAATRAGHPVSGSDVYGLAQRGGSVWGMVRIGNPWFSPLVPQGQADILVALEKLEGLRWASHLKPGGKAIINNHHLHPTPVLLEKEEYPADIPAMLIDQGYQVISVDALKIASDLGNIRVANTVLLGAMSVQTDLDQRHWLEAIAARAPRGTEELNKKAFLEGAQVKGQQ